MRATSACNKSYWVQQISRDITGHDRPARPCPPGALGRFHEHGGNHLQDPDTVPTTASRRPGDPVGGATVELYPPVEGDHHQLPANGTAMRRSSAAVIREKNVAWPAYFPPVSGRRRSRRKYPVDRKHPRRWVECAWGTRYQGRCRGRCSKHREVPGMGGGRTRTAQATAMREIATRGWMIASPLR